MILPENGPGRSCAPPAPTLTDRHGTEQEDSGYPSKYAMENGVHSLTGLRAAFNGATKLGWSRPAFGRGDALVYPYHDADGVYLELSRLKFDIPRVEVREGGREKEIKYEWPRGKPHSVYIPIGTREAIRRCTDLIVTEGEKKALCADYHGFPCVSVPGVWAWQKKGVMIPSLAAIRWAERTVYIAFDSDAVTNPNVLSAETALAKALTCRGATVKVIRFPEGGAA